MFFCGSDEFNIAAILSSNMRRNVGEYNTDRQGSWTKFFLANVT